MSMPASACWRTTVSIDSLRQFWYALWSYGSRSSILCRNSTSCGGRTRLPTWVVRMRLALDAILLPPGLGSLTLLITCGSSRQHQAHAAEQNPARASGVFGSQGNWVASQFARRGRADIGRIPRNQDGALVERRVDLVVILFHELDVARKLNGLRRLQRLVELFQHLLLVLRRNCLVGGDVRDLFLDRVLGLGERLGLGIDAGHHHGDVADHLVIVVEIRESVLLD